jgi:antitoxin HigA-1
MAKKIPNIHPGEILEEEFLKPLNITAYKLAKDTDIPATRISQKIKHKSDINARGVIENWDSRSVTNDYFEK